MTNLRRTRRAAIVPGPPWPETAWLTSWRDASAAGAFAGKRPGNEHQRRAQRTRAEVRTVGFLDGWPVLEQLKQRDWTGFGRSSHSKRSIELRPRTADADTVVKSV